MKNDDDAWMYLHFDPEVCMTHKRFMPCRRDDGCEYSAHDEDIAYVRAYQQGETE